MGPAQFNRARLAERAEQGWITVTELADTLVRDHGVPFKASHRVAVRFVAECDRRPSDPRSAVLRDVSAAVLGQAIEYDEPSLATVLSARHFVEVRTTPGGPAPAETARAVAASRQLLASDEDWLGMTRGRLAAADAALRRRAAMI
jgi:argininosuccinate lyase